MCEWRRCVGVTGHLRCEAKAPPGGPRRGQWPPSHVVTRLYFCERQARAASFTTVLPASSYLGESLDRIPRVQILSDDGNSVTGVSVVATVASVQPATRQSTLLFSCTTADTMTRLFTLEDDRFRDVCQPVLAPGTALQVLLEGDSVSSTQKVHPLPLLVTRRPVESWESCRFLLPRRQATSGSRASPTFPSRAGHLACGR